MVWQYNPYAFPLFVSAAVTGGLAVFMLGRRRTPSATAFMLLLLAATEWSLAAAGKSLTADLYSNILWDKAAYLGLVSVPVMWIIFVLQYTERGSWLRRRTLLLLWVVPILTVLLTWTNEAHHLIYIAYEMVPYGSLVMSTVTYGVWFYFLVAYSYLLVFFGMALLLEQGLSARGVLRGQSVILVVAALLPLVGDAVNVIGYHYPADLAPLAFAFTGLLGFWVVFRFQLLKILPVAREAVIRNMADGVIVIDATGSVVDMNAAGEKMVGVKAAEAVGMPVAELLKPFGVGASFLAKAYSEIALTSGERYFDVNVSDLQDTRGASVGRVAVLRDVTERKKAEEAVRESEDKFSRIFQSTPDPVTITRLRDGVYLEVNRAFTSVTGFAREEVVGHSSLPSETGIWTSLEDREKFAKNLKEKGEVSGLETSLRMKDGSTKFATLTARQIEISGESCVLTIAHDITERKRMEDEVKRYSEHLEELVKERTSSLAESEVELRSARNRLEHVLATNPAVLYFEEPLPDFSDTLSTFVSESARFVLGFEPNSFLGEAGLKFWRSRLHPDDLTRYRAELPSLWRDGQHTFEYRFLHADGSYRWIAEQYKVIRDAEGRVLNAVAVAMDVTDRKRMEEELEAAKKRLEYVITSNPAAIFAGKPLPDCCQWYSSYISDRVTGIVGFGPKDFIGHPGFWESRIHPDDLGSMSAAAAHLKDGHYACDFRFLHKDGTYRWIREEARLIRDDNGNPLEVIGYWTDITELKEFEQRLQQAEHLAAIGETAAMVGHDLRNPLQGIAGATYLLREESLTAKERNDMLDLIEKNVEYSDGIVKDLLDYARPFKLVRVEMTPKEIAASALQAVHVPDRIKVQDLSQAQPTISADPDRMKRAFVNLVENAVDAMPTGGTLAINSKESNGFVEITLSDTGTGLSKEVTENLWKPLQTTKPKGMGMGLAICKRIIDAHGGEVSVESKMGLGTTFTIRLHVRQG